MLSFIPYAMLCHAWQSHKSNRGDGADYQRINGVIFFSCKQLNYCLTHASKLIDGVLVNRNSKCRPPWVLGNHWYQYNIYMPMQMLQAFAN